MCYRAAQALDVSPARQNRAAQLRRESERGGIASGGRTRQNPWLWVEQLALVFQLPAVLSVMVTEVPMATAVEQVQFFPLSWLQAPDGTIVIPALPVLAVMAKVVVHRVVEVVVPWLVVVVVVGWVEVVVVVGAVVLVLLVVAVLDVLLVLDVVLLEVDAVPVVAVVDETSQAVIRGSVALILVVRLTVCVAPAFRPGDRDRDVLVGREGVRRDGPRPRECRGDAGDRIVAGGDVGIGELAGGGLYHFVGAQLLEPGLGEDRRLGLRLGVAAAFDDLLLETSERKQSERDNGQRDQNLQQRESTRGGVAAAR